MITTAKLNQRTQEDWEQYNAGYSEYQSTMPQRIMRMLMDLQYLGNGTPVNQLEHALQTATLAERAGASEEMVVAALCHDIGKTISIENHAAIGAEILKPYVSQATYEVLRTHAEFQAKHYNAVFGLDTNLRQKYRHRNLFDAACQFSDHWDLNASDSKFNSFTLDHFYPALERIFSAPKPPPWSTRARIRLFLLKLKGIVFGGYHSS